MVEVETIKWAVHTQLLVQRVSVRISMAIAVRKVERDVTSSGAWRGVEVGTCTEEQQAGTNGPKDGRRSYNVGQIVVDGPKRSTVGTTHAGLVARVQRQTPCIKATQHPTRCPRNNCFPMPDANNASKTQHDGCQLRVSSRSKAQAVPVLRTSCSSKGKQSTQYLSCLRRAMSC